MEVGAKAVIIGGVSSVLILLSLGSTSTAQNPRKDNYAHNIGLCNGSDRASLESRILGCTALINAGEATPAALAIAHNNRGNAFIVKGDYERAIQDLDRSIKLNGTYAKPFNNRGVARLKKGEYDLAVEAFDEAVRLNPNYGEAFANRAQANL
jgi:tetratricopeptide (TPR) repeat protein